MFNKQDKRRLKCLLLDTVRMLCKNGLPADSSFRIEATIGISMSNGDTMVISFNERIQPDGSVIQHMWSDDEEHGESNTDDVKIENGESDASELDSGCQRVSGSCKMSAEKQTGDDLVDDFSTIHSFTDSQNLSTDSSKYLMAEKLGDESSSYASIRGCSFDDTPSFAVDSPNRRVYSSSRQSLSFGETANEDSPVFVKLETDESQENFVDEPNVIGKQKPRKTHTIGRTYRHSLLPPNSSSAQFRRNMYMRQTTNDRPTLGTAPNYRRKVSSRRTDGQLAQNRPKGQASQVIWYDLSVN
jgi:hypothetical protein